MNSPKVSVIIVTYNSARYLPALFEALKSQTIYSDMEIIVVDNNSDTETKQFLRRQNIQLIENTENAGFARANNQGIARSRGEYILCLNHDVVLDERYIEECVTFLKTHKEVGSVSGFIKKWDFEHSKFTEIVDTLGFKIFKNHKVIDQNIISFDMEGKAEVFGVSAAVAMYSKHAIDEIQRISGTFFDEDLGSYKEDVDVAYRLRHAGYTSYVIDSARAFHDRWETGSSNADAASGMKARKVKSGAVNQMSYRNHLIVLLKNEYVLNFLLFGVFILIFEIKKFTYLLLFERSTLSGIFSFFKSISLTLKKRHDIFINSKISASGISKWFR